MPWRANSLAKQLLEKLGTEIAPITVYLSVRPISMILRRTEGRMDSGCSAAPKKQTQM